MKVTFLFAFFLFYSSLSFSQTKNKTPDENQKFYFPAASFANEEDYNKNLNVLVSKIAPTEIDEKNRKFSDDADLFYLMQKDYKGLANYAKNDKFPKESLPLKSYAEAMIVDPTQGARFKKSFTENFSNSFNELDEPTKTAIAGDYYDMKRLGEYQKMMTSFKEELSKSKTDSISYKDAKKLIGFEALKSLVMTTLPLASGVVKDYVIEYFQPYITGNLFLSIVKPTEVNDLPDLTKDYKILLEIVNFSSTDTKDTAFKNENAMLIEGGRIINLHIASGIPADKLHVVFVIHGPAVDFLLNDKMYEEKYKVANPNLELIKQMQGKGIKFIVCGQIMTFFGYKLSDLTENVKEAYSAKTALSNYQTQGYIYYKLSEE